MDATFSITPDTSCGMLRIRMAGFYEQGDIVRFEQAIDAAHAALRMRPNEHVTLVDIRDMDIQASGSVAEFQRILANPGRSGRRIAFVVARSLASMQIRRAAEGRGASYFVDLEPAEAWLLAARPRREPSGPGDPRYGQARSVAGR